MLTRWALLVHYGTAVGATLVATALSLAFEPVIVRVPFAFYFGAVAISAHVGGLGPGMLATALGVLSVGFFLFAPEFSPSLSNARDGLALLVLGLVAGGISWAIDGLRRARFRAEAAEVAERRQREWFDTTLSSIGDAVIATDERGIVTFLNPVAQALTGWGGDTAIGRALGEIFEIFDERTREPAVNPAARVLHERTVVGLANHTILRARDGCERAIEDSAAPILNRTGDLIGVVLVFRDVSNRRAAQSARQQFVSLIESSGDFVGMCDLDMVPFYVNTAGLRMMGLDSLEQARQVPVAEFFFPEDRSVIMGDFFERVRRDGRGEIETRFRHFKTGEPLWVIYSVVALADEFGRPSGYGTVTRDVSDRKRAEAALRESEERLRAVWESASDAMALSDPHGTVLAANPAYYRLLGYEPEQVIGQNFALIFPEDQRAEAAEQYRAVFAADARVPSFEAVIRRADGSDVPVEARYDFVVQDGRRTGMVSMVRDVSERRALERMQRDFISMVGHELRTPLSALRGHAQLMKRRQTFAESSVDVIIDQADRLERLIRDLTDVSRLEAGRLSVEREPMDLVELVYRCAEQARGQAQGHVIRVDGPDKPIIGRWDRDRLAQVMTNLLSNAIKYSPEGGEVLVTIERRPGDVLVAVQDRGLGIPVERLAHVFDRFYRVQETAAMAGGLGLGLYISKLLIGAHGGRIWAASDGPGQGSTFSFTLPLNAVAPTD
ncbi:MAG: PAS domain S-box protein [Chloroflexota bacterium]